MTTTRRPDSGSPGNDAEEIRADIAEARSELGDTVQALAAKADVKQHARDAADSAKARVTDATETARVKVSEATETARHKVSEATETAQAKLQEKAPQLVEAAGTAKAKTLALAEKAQENPKVRDAVAKVRQRPVPVAAVVGALVLAYVVLRRRRNR
jgi:vacuolar-type H+-ATPase subunit H